MKKYTPLILIVIAVLCFYYSSFYLKYKGVVGVIGCFLVFASLAIFSAENKKNISSESIVKVPKKGIRNGWIVVIIFGIVEILLAAGAMNDNNHTLQWIFFFSIPAFFMVFIVNLIVGS
jgi:hypothetical protein